jgi:type IV pilus biogenesis protein CpaD/CtpE
MKINIILTMVAVGLTLAGCQDPFQERNNWSATGATREDTAVQVANPEDLISGVSQSGSSGVVAAAAVDKAIGGAAGTAAGLQVAPAAL